MMGTLWSSCLLSGGPLEMVLPDGQRQRLPVEAWRAAWIPGDDALLDRCSGPTLDLGCGPGRLAAALTARGVPALGIDLVTEAVSLARDAGAVALRRSVFDRLPAEGRWTTALLADGNVGIGGDPVALLARVRALLAADGQALVELEAPGSGTRSLAVRLASDGRHGPPFAWARVAADDLPSVAASVGLAVPDIWEEADRWFASLTPC
jgi:SAM-dependent methyltransferase